MRLTCPGLHLSSLQVASLPDFTTLVAASLVPASKPSPPLAPSTHVDVIMTPRDDLDHGVATEFRVVVAVCQQALQVVTLTLPLSAGHEVDAWRWTVHEVPSTLHQFMGWAARSDSSTSSGAGAGAGAGSGARAARRLAATNSYMSVLNEDPKTDPSSPMHTTTGEMQSHWVPFEGLSTEPQRPTEVLDVCVLTGADAKDFKGRVLVAVL